MALEAGGSRQNGRRSVRAEAPEGRASTTASERGSGDSKTGGNRTERRVP